MSQYYSQHGEDRWIVEHLELPERGTFVEVGAYDGIELSNTYHFEQKGWTGLCIEADPRMWHRLLLNRQCNKFFGLASPVPGTVAFDMMEIPSHSGVGRGGKTIQVPSLPLGDLLDAYMMFDVDLLSLDTEGTELHVWESASFNCDHRYPRIVIIEHDTAGLPSAREAILDYFKLLPYGLVHETTGNLIFERTKALPEGH